MSIIKSFSVGHGDMFYIDHESDSLTIIDCCYRDENQKARIFISLKWLAAQKRITRFISTHPDEDHIYGLEALDDLLHIENFYVVNNEAIKYDVTENFERYCKLRDGEHAYYVYRGCTRKWLNLCDDSHGAAGIRFLWPDTTNKEYRDALNKVKNGEGYNNISPIFIYSMSHGIKAMWMGDIETTFLDKIKNSVEG